MTLPQPMRSRIESIADQLHTIGERAYLISKSCDDARYELEALCVLLDNGTPEA